MQHGSPQVLAEPSLSATSCMPLLELKWLMQQPELRTPTTHLAKRPRPPSSSRVSMLLLCACCRLPLVQGSRVWRHGIPSFIALNWEFPADKHPDYVSSQL